MRGRRRWRSLASSGGALLATAALACALTWTHIFDAMLAWQMALSPTSVSYQKWVAPTVPIYLEIFMFNWTNADRFPDEKPRFEQLGPYRFREVRSHVNVSFFPQNSSVAYRTMRSWHFDHSSNGSLHDNITTLNIVAASAVFRLRHKGIIEQMMASGVLMAFSQHVSVSKTVGQMLFEGYEEPILELAKTLPASLVGDGPLVDRVGWFYGRNNTIDSDGYVEVSSGAASGTIPGQMLKWNYQDTLPYYEGRCAQISGSAGEFLPRGLDEKSTLTMFVPDLCRTVHMQYQSSGQLQGLDYHKYAFTEDSFDYSAESSENTCFCHEQCLWGGVMNVSACRFGSPSFLSLPHFLYADPVLRENVEGMNPDPDLHSFYFAVEPKLGVPLDVGARFQFNVFIEPNPYTALYRNFPRMLFPIFWVQQKVQVSDEILAEIRMVRVLADWGGIVCACIAVMLAVISILLAVCLKIPKYTSPIDLLVNKESERPKDEAELKLNPK